jgi:hypothetical protein
MPMLEAQDWYERLKQEFEKAGKILNARSVNNWENGWVCFMAGKPNACAKGIVRTGKPAGIDNSYTTPRGKFVQVLVCTMRCWELYQAQRIDERRQRELDEAEELRQQ